MSINSYMKNFYNKVIGNSDFARPYLFRIVISGPVSIPLESVYFVRSSEMPIETFDEIKVPRMYSEVKLFGKVTYNDWTVEFADDITFKIYKAFKNWKNYIYDPTSGVVGTKESFVGKAYVQVLDNNLQPQLEFSLNNIWISKIDNPTLSYSTEDIYKFKVTFKYDKYIAD